MRLPQAGLPVIAQEAARSRNPLWLWMLFATCKNPITHEGLPTLDASGSARLIDGPPSVRLPNAAATYRALWI